MQLKLSNNKSIATHKKKKHPVDNIMHSAFIIMILNYTASYSRYLLCQNDRNYLDNRPN